jgi:hypothetical protein
LAGSWRRSVPALDLAAEALESVAPALLDKGAGALGWWRVRHSGLRATAPARQLHQAYRLHALEALEHERHLEHAVSGLRSAGIEPILIKGWASARLYPEPGLRPYGDLDLCVHPDQLTEAMDALTKTAPECGPAELHEGVPDVPDRSWEELYRRSRLAPLGPVEVRVLGPEDQLRQLCLHFWRHNAFRPLWLCDIAATLETAPPDFDWDFCLSGDRVLVDWTLTMCALACRLLGARVEQPAIATAHERLPLWVVRTVLWKWGPGSIKRPLSHYARHPTELPGAILHRWLDPIKACYRFSLPARRPVAWVRSHSLLGQPFVTVLRARRLIRTRFGRSRAQAQPFALHPRAASRFE